MHHQKNSPDIGEVIFRVLLANVLTLNVTRRAGFGQVFKEIDKKFIRYALADFNPTSFKMIIIRYSKRYSFFTVFPDRESNPGRGGESAES